MVPIVSCTGDEATCGPKLLTSDLNFTPQADEFLSKLWQLEIGLYIWGRSVLSGSQRVSFARHESLCGEFVTCFGCSVALFEAILIEA